MPNHDMSQTASIERAAHHKTHELTEQQISRLIDTVTNQQEVLKLLSDRCTALHGAINTLVEIVELNDDACKERIECLKQDS